jgi:predicted ATPase/class 3 adenylate cyclase
METGRFVTAGSARGLPSGTVAFLFTDVEGSTVRWDRDAAAMQRAVRRHDDLMRAAIVAHNGHVFKTIGDAFCAVFWQVDDALRASLAAQRSLDAEDFSSVEGMRVRMALHVGSSDERDGDYFGPTLNRVARLLAIGHGGQVLLSGKAAESVAALPSDVTFKDLGDHRLKDLTASEHVFQVIAAGLAVDFPKLRSLSVLSNNLPLQIASLVGRESDVIEIKSLLEGSRLVTLTGTGGVGKTRCALQVGAETLDEFADGVWFIDLAPLHDPSLVPNVIASVLDVQETPTQSMHDALINHLRHKDLVLIVDNCEHVVAEASKIAGAILRDCPNVSILATSREALALVGEAVYQMPSLAVPETLKDITADTALRYGAVALFDARARSANNRFSLSDENAQTVAEICKRLDGIPLAIELAAARLKVLSPQQLSKKLDERFRVLTGGDRGALPRQQTMRALIDWSYDLLSETEKRLFRSLSIFAGAFTLDFATVICADEDADGDVFDVLSSLVDKSLVQVESADADNRYRLLESVRQYAREKLTDAGEYASLAGRHARAYVTFAEKLDGWETTSNRPEIKPQGAPSEAGQPAWDVTPDSEWIAQAEPEMDNWRDARAWAYGPEGEILVGQRLAAATIWQELAHAEGRRYVREALDAATPHTPRALVGKLEIAASKIESLYGQFRASLASAESALAVFEGLKDARGLAQARLCAGRALLFLGREAEGEAMLQAARAYFHQPRALKAEGAALSALGAARILVGDVPAARSLLQEAARTYEAAGAQGRLPAVLSMLAEAEFRAGDSAAAVRVASEALEAHRALERGPNVVNLLYNTAAYLTDLGRYDEARTYARESLAAALEEQAETDIAISLQHLAAISALSGASGDTTQMKAARILGFVNARFASLESAREYTEQKEYDKVFAVLGSKLGIEQRDALISEGANWAEALAVAEALAITTELEYL